MERELGALIERVEGIRADVHEVRDDVRALRAEVSDIKIQRERGKGWVTGALAVAALALHALGWLVKLAPLVLLWSCATLPACDTPAKWETRPVNVVLDESMPDRCKVAAEDGLLFWSLRGVAYLEVSYREHGWVGFQGLVPRGHIAITHGPLSPGVGGETHWADRFGEMIWAETTLATCDWRIATHEIGHALGLADHTNIDGFVMCWTVGCFGPRLTSHELEWVQ